MVMKGAITGERSHTRLVGQGSRLRHPRRASAVRPVGQSATLETSPKIVSQGSPTKKEAWWEKGSKSGNVVAIEGYKELIDLMDERRDHLVVLHFFAKWCGACKALHPKFIKLADEYPDVIFAKVMLDDNKQLTKALGVRALPYFQFYRGSAGKVAEFPASLSRVEKVRSTLAEHNSERCSLLEETPNAESILNISPSDVAE